MISTPQRRGSPLIPAEIAQQLSGAPARDQGAQGQRPVAAGAGERGKRHGEQPAVSQRRGGDDD